MFSVLMSLYEKEEPENLRQCLESLNSQTMKASEIVIVYDGYIGESLKKIVDSYRDVTNIKTVILANNVGLGNALQRGLECCSYDIIARMDTDDICRPDRFEKQIGQMSLNKNLDILGASIVEFDEDSNERLKILPKTNTEIRSFAIWKNPLNHMTVVFRKKSVLSVGGYKHHLFMEDYNLWLRMLANNMNFQNMSEPLVYARVGKGMVTKRRGLNYIKSEIELMKIKKRLGFTGFVYGLVVFSVRSATRVVPSGILSFLYNKDRKKIR